MHVTEAFARADSVLPTAHFVALGITAHELTAAVREGRLIRLRRGLYCLPGCDPQVQQAVRVGGLLACTSAARMAGLWVPDDPFPHIWLDHSSSRMRSPRARQIPLTADTRDGVELHWSPLAFASARGSGAVSIMDALIQIVRCQPRPLAIAALDSALYTKIIRSSDLDAIFRALPKKYARLRAHLDARSMSGIESILRIALREAGIACDIQVRIEGVGRVDLVAAEWIAIETDGRANHAGDAHQRRDYDRDVRLALLGFTVLRFNYRQVMFELESVIAAVKVAIRNHRRIH